MPPLLTDKQEDIYGDYDMGKLLTAEIPKRLGFISSLVHEMESDEHTIAGLPSDDI